MEQAELHTLLTQVLRGAVFPLSARQIIWLARENDAQAASLTLLSQLPGREFSSLEAVERALETPQAEGPAATSSRPPDPTAR